MANIMNGERKVIIVIGLGIITFLVWHSNYIFDLFGIDQKYRWLLTGAVGGMAGASARASIASKLPTEVHFSLYIAAGFVIGMAIGAIIAFNIFYDFAIISNNQQGVVAFVFGIIVPFAIISSADQLILFLRKITGDG